ncbi:MULTISPECIES: hypothetical protein [unclassified Duganella]|uniref:hypothetical protein n=1 Tax=unclassified Duganella TaxID=2636909 RepID=UPI000873EDC6|nr:MULTISPECIES: hypothetical protein [unclassified Duganella]
MENATKESLGFVYRVEGYRQADDLYRGWIILMQRSSGEVVYEPPVIIETPAAFRTAHAAEIEAAVYMRELIMSGRIYTTLPPGERRSVPRFQQRPQDSVA